MREVLIFRLRSYHVLISYSAERIGPKFYKTLMFLGQAGMFLSFQARRSSATRSSTSGLTVDAALRILFMLVLSIKLFYTVKKKKKKLLVYATGLRAQVPGLSISEKGRISTVSGGALHAHAEKNLADFQNFLAPPNTRRPRKKGG